MTDGRLALLRELVSMDEERAAALDEVDRLVADTAAVRARAGVLAELCAAAPSERARIDGEVSEAEHEVHVRSAALVEAEAALAEAESSRDEERLAAARRVAVRARDALSIAEKRAAAFRAEASELEQRLAEAEREVPAIEARAAELAYALRDQPRLANEASREPGPGLAGVAEWASGARAALLVVQSGLSAERDAVIRQANELGSSVLGEPLVVASTALVVQQVERALEPAGGKPL